MKKRIEFIDLAKGICIFLVVLGHCNVPIFFPGFEIVRMPLYFILSGLFFKDYGGWTNFLIRKTNKILIPFLFFYLLGNILLYIIKFVSPSLLITNARGFLDLFDNRQFFNGPIWFLLCLFWCNIIYCTLSLYVRNNHLRMTLICFIGFLGWYLGHLNVFIPLFLDVAMTALPFFAFGYVLKHTQILYPNKYDNYNILIAAGFWSISFFLSITTDYRLSLHYNAIEGWSTYVIAITSVMSILFLCKILKYIPIISYAGRYSIVILCTHHFIYRPIKVLFNHVGINESYTPMLVGISTLLFTILLIPLCIKFIPYFIAQKDLIKIKSNEK